MRCFKGPKRARRRPKPQKSGLRPLSRPALPPARFQPQACPLRRRGRTSPRSPAFGGGGGGVELDRAGLGAEGGEGGGGHGGMATRLPNHHDRLSDHDGSVQRGPTPFPKIPDSSERAEIAIRAVLNYTHSMRRASVSEARNSLSALLSEVLAGETVIITRRGKPVAQIGPCEAVALTDADVAKAAILNVADPPKSSSDVATILAIPVPRLPAGCSASRLVSQERDESL